MELVLIQNRVLFNVNLSSRSCELRVKFDSVLPTSHLWFTLTDQKPKGFVTEYSPFYLVGHDGSLSPLNQPKLGTFRHFIEKTLTYFKK